jgi:tripartite-type tricarboxylate transporter receptor subunit TctC
MHMTRRGLLAAGGALALPALARAQDGPVRIVVPAPPGAFNDGLARLLADRLPAGLGQSVVVENKAGAGGMIGTREVVQARPDGRTIGIANTATMAINPHLFSNAGYDPLKDLTPVAGCAEIMIVMVATQRVPVSTVAELVAAAKARPGALNYASAGIGGSTHLAFELFKLRAGVDLTHVPYRGAAPVATALLSREIDVAFEGVPLMLPHIQNGTLKPLAVSGSSRHPALPEVPTMKEAGIDYEMAIWFGLVAPNGVPAPMLAKLEAETLKVLRDPAMAERVAGQGARVTPRSAAEFGAFMRAENAKFGEVVRTARIQAQ